MPADVAVDRIDGGYTVTATLDLSGAVKSRVSLFVVVDRPPAVTPGTIVGQCSVVCTRNFGCGDKQVCDGLPNIDYDHVCPADTVREDLTAPVCPRSCGREAFRCIAVQ